MYCCPGIFIWATISWSLRTMIKFKLDLSVFRDWKSTSKTESSALFISPFKSPHLEYTFVTTPNIFAFIIREKDSVLSKEEIFRFTNSFMTISQKAYEDMVSHNAK